MAKAIFCVPSPIGRSQRSFCSGVPCRVRMLPTIAGETTIRRSAQPFAVISSPTAASARMPRPLPPYSSGTFTPRYPWLARASQSSVGGSSFWILVRVYWGPKSEQIFATVSRIWRSSSVGMSGRAGLLRSVIGAFVVESVGLRLFEDRDVVERDPFALDQEPGIAGREAAGLVDGELGVRVVRGHHDDVTGAPVRRPEHAGPLHARAVALEVVVD